LFALLLLLYSTLHLRPTDVGLLVYAHRH
jgi:hypothetical protein